jgi:hypothetical protein
VLQDLISAVPAQEPMPEAAPLQAPPVLLPDDVEAEMPLLKDETPFHDRLLFNLVAKFSLKKGHGMWDDVVVAYIEMTGQHIEKPALQMKFFRAKSKWVIWTPDYVSVLGPPPPPAPRR